MIADYDNWDATAMAAAVAQGDVSAGELLNEALARVEALSAHPAFSLTNPNKIYALFGAYFRANPGEFHRVDGAGYRFWADRIRDINARNPQVASRMARVLEHWRRFTPALQSLARAQIEALVADAALSPDVREVLEKALG